MNHFNKEEIKNKLLNFTIQEVKIFLIENPNLEFYAFAFDCNFEYAEINLCFNTEADFAKTLAHYKTGEFSSYYQSEKEINDLKFNTGDWNQQGFASINVLTEDELTKIFNDLPNDDYKSWKEFLDCLTKAVCECLIDFTNTETFNGIPKTQDFLAFCIDHDEDFETAIERIENVRLKYNSH